MTSPATYRKIAEELYISEETIRTHAKNILGKLQAPTERRLS